jgi:hypothetical protein
LDAESKKIAFSRAPQIDVVTVPGVPGKIGLTSCPGLREGSGGVPGEECLNADLQILREWGATVVVSLLDDLELKTLGVPELGGR